MCMPVFCRPNHLPWLHSYAASPDVLLLPTKQSFQVITVKDCYGSFSLQQKHVIVWHLLKQFLRLFWLREQFCFSGRKYQLKWKIRKNPCKYLQWISDSLANTWMSEISHSFTHSLLSEMEAQKFTI